jgi:cytochrome bd-type quinol oxidase subunit 2
MRALDVAGRVALCLLHVTVVVSYSAVEHGHNFRHYTNWAYLLCTVALVADLTRLYTHWPVFRTASSVLTPTAAAVSSAVCALTAGMYYGHAAVVRDAYRQHPDNAVNFMNVVLHVEPAVTMIALLVRTAPCLDVSGRGAAVFMTCMFVCFCYFTTTSATDRYGIGTRS